MLQRYMHLCPCHSLQIHTDTAMHLSTRYASPLLCSCCCSWCWCLCWCCAGPLFSQLASLRSFIRELRPLLGSASTAAALTAADELQALGQLLVAWGVHKEQLLLEPLLTPQAEYFSGALFQVCCAAHVAAVVGSRCLHVLGGPWVGHV
jgi:hypothetical protein